MKQDDEQKNDDIQNKPEHDLDAETLDNEDTAQKPDDEPIAVIDTSKYRSGLSIEEWSKLKKQDPSTLTPAQKRAVETADEQAKKAAQALSSRLSEITNVGKTASDVLKKFSVGSAFKNISLPTIPQIEPLHASIIEDMKPSDFAVVPQPTAKQQAKQTMLLERLVEGFEAQNAERNADTQRLLTPSYDAKSRILIFANTIIEIPIGDQELVCKTLFRAGKPVSKPIGIGDVLIKMGVAIDQLKGNKRVHYAKAHLNTTVAKKVHVDDLFEIENKHIWFNQKYL